MPFHIADLKFISNDVINIAHLHSYRNLQNVKEYKNPDNVQVTILFLYSIVLKGMNFKH